ncbi:hypothetical protein A0H81_05811 [Grifola frondosa]|uniref:Uncharacterized protein n=1 Tax=Grifola frondosa TaxID=5627 RepID=A0A1C7MC68_GRIFR|nr:hypothetical protein A0H81_05811 [Grifola frondosa]
MATQRRARAAKAALRRVEMELDEADEMVSQMEIEIQGRLARYKKLSKDMHAQLSRADLLGERDCSLELRSLRTVVEADTSIDRASGTLKKMIRHVVTWCSMLSTRFVTAGIVAVLY